MEVRRVLDVFSAANLRNLDAIKADCGTAFTAKERGSGDSYSQGSTYFVLGNCSSPNCLLEELALSIFDFHFAGTASERAESGVEWWTQVIDSRDEISWHWDRDYQLEEDAGIHKYPMLATVTYLTAEGAPTVILNCRGSDEKTRSCNQKVDSWVLSKPLIGKHLYFSGNLLHAAPSNIVESESESESETGNESGSESGSESSALRITFLANIWFGHIPKGSVRFSADKFPSLLKPLKSRGLDFTNAEKRIRTFHEPPDAAPGDEASSTNMVARRFRDEHKRYQISLVLPCQDLHKWIVDANTLENAGGDMAIVTGGRARVYELESSSSEESDDEDEQESSSTGSPSTKPSTKKQRCEK